MISIEGIAATTVIAVVLALTEHVIDLIFQPFERKCWSLLITFAGVVEHNIKDDFDPGSMQSFHHLLEFTYLRTGCLVMGVSTMR